MDLAVKVEGGEFTWDAPPPEVSQGSKSPHAEGKSGAVGEKAPVLQETVFGLKNVNMEIPKGKLVAIVGKALSTDIALE